MEEYRGRNNSFCKSLHDKELFQRQKMESMSFQAKKAAWRKHNVSKALENDKILSSMLLQSIINK